MSKCDCEEPGFYCSGVPGILAHMEDGVVASDLPHMAVERCDACRRYPSDAAAYQELVERGLVRLSLQDIKTLYEQESADEDHA
jgi:hypothetical protein